MSADATVDPAAPNLNLTPEEKHVYGQLFRQADTDTVGVVTGEVAVKFFEKTRLDSRVLGEIWQIADNENRGFLTPAGFGIVLRLIGHCQAGREPSAEIALQQGPLPRFDGISTTTLSSPPPPAAAVLQSQGTGGPIRIPPLTPEKVTQYASLFERQGLQGGGLLPGDQAKQIFEKSGMPNEVLGRIWQLADTEQRGALVMTEFVIAMHLLTSMKTGTLRGLPNILPAALYEAATRRAAPARQSPTSTGPISAIPRQLSGSAPIRTGSPLGRPPLTAQSTGLPTTTGDWLVTPADKARFDLLYIDLDKSRKGFITGEEAVPFLSQSNLPEDSLAQIWDLADFRSEGRLNKDTFAVAMYLIRQQRTSHDGSKALPTQLPPNLIPPSMRAAARPPTAGSPFDAPPPTQPPVPAPAPAPKSALDDLFGLDTSPTPPAAQLQTALSTGGSNANDPFATGTGALAPSSPGRPSPTATQFRPFMPSSSFGRGLTAQATGDSTSSSAGRVRSPIPASISEDLLGDNDPEISKKLTNETAELANLSNQVGSLSKQMQEVQGQRTTTQNELNQASAQKKNFEQRLSQLRTLYEKEAGDVRSLQEQLTAARNDTKKLQAECMNLDGTCRDLQTQRQQILASLQADQQENASLKEKIRAVNAEVAQLKPQIDKLRSEARQQKGLVAINKKQLVTNEGERDKLQSELADLNKSSEDLARQVNTSSPVFTAAQVASPALSTASGNNPFFRRTGSTDIMGAFASPPIKQFSDKSFDDVFGPGPLTAGTTSTPPPPLTSFKAQTTGTSTGSVGSFATPPAASPNISRQATLTAEPPAPPISRQISSSFLPFADAAESLSSSRQVSPPASNVGAPEPASTEPPLGVAAFPIEAVATGQSATSTSDKGVFQDDSKPSSNGFTGPFDEIKAVPVATSGVSHADPFAVTDQNKAKADFDNAFASFKNANKAQEQSKTDAAKDSTAFDSEFPPIAELERDEDSDSASEQGGFEDDFTPASPPGKAFETPKELASPSTITAPNHADAAASAEDDVPAFGPVPTEQSDIPLSPPGAFPASPPPVPLADDIFGSAHPDPTTSSASQPPIITSAAEKTPFDDLDDDFEGLEDAKEGSADDDFQTISRSGLDDFNAVFDSSPPPSQAKSESTAFGAESSYDFGTVSSTSAAAGVGSTGSAASSGAQQQAPAPPESHDWDAIFATLDSPTESAATVTSPPAKDEARPAALGRVQTEDGVHDDPILKNLTGMGYSRSDALLALEKYDYNLERAANYLASQS